MTTYTIKPSVTQLLDLLNKPALLKWANKIGMEGVSLDDYRKKSMADGSSLHKQVERFIKDKTPFEDKDFQARFEAFFADKEIIAFEQSVTTRNYTGRLDIKYKWADAVYICDFKSNHKDIYLENRLQLSAYRAASGADRVGIISIPDMKLMELPIKDFSPYEHFLNLLSDVWQAKQKLDTLKFYEHD